MHAVAYVSAASWNLLDEQLERIVSESRRLNALNGITGVLLYCDGNFMQYLEGEEAAVIETFARIRASESHYQVSELMNQPILEREFSEWAMGFSRPVPEEFVELTAARLRGSVPEEFVELTAARLRGSAQSGPGATLLRSFWMCSRASLG